MHYWLPWSLDLKVGTSEELVQQIFNAAVLVLHVVTHSLLAKGMGKVSNGPGPVGALRASHLYLYVSELPFLLIFLL
jgi:hypothetical protein